MSDKIGPVLVALLLFLFIAGAAFEAIRTYYPQMLTSPQHTSAPTQRNTSPKETATSQFIITANNGVLDQGLDSNLNIWYNYTVYASVKHLTQGSAENTITLECTLTRSDLTNCTRDATISDLPVGSEQIISFFFSNSDLEGQLPLQYVISG